MSEDRQELREVHEAVQALSNAIRAEDGRDIAIVPHALIVWEEIGFDSNGGQGYQLQYATTGSPTMAASLGLAVAGSALVEDDVLGEDDDE